MKKKHKKKKQQVMFNVSDDNTLDGTTTPQGSTARGRTHPGGIFTGTFSIQKSYQSSSHRSAGHWSTGHQSSTHRARIHHRSIGPCSNKHKSTSHRSSSHRSLEIDYQTPGKSQLSTITGHLSNYQTSVCGSHTVSTKYTANNKSNLGSEHSFKNESQNPTTTTRRVLVPMESDFSNMSDPSIVIEPPSITRVMQKVLSLIGFLGFIPGIF